uniref:Uncharacterized protein n=1 Tax=Romanomermis culicivorax TaxID=13658 RepID=A0A915K019_ROMCU
MEESDSDTEAVVPLDMEGPDLYSSVTNSKDSRRWAYEIHSTFLTPTATSASVKITSDLLKIGKVSQARLLKMTEIVPNHCIFYYLVILQTSKHTSKLLKMAKLCKII